MQATDKKTGMENEFLEPPLQFLISLILFFIGGPKALLLVFGLGRMFLNRRCAALIFGALHTLPYLLIAKDEGQADG